MSVENQQESPGSTFEQALKDFIQDVPKKVCLPTPAANQTIVYSSEDDEVILAAIGEGDSQIYRFTPDQARSLASRLLDEADDIDGGYGAQF